MKKTVKSLGAFNAVIIVACMLLLVANIISIIYAVNVNQSLDTSDVISVVVTIILGVSTIVQAAQEEKMGRISVDLDVKNNTPYFAIVPVVEDPAKINDYLYHENDMEKANDVSILPDGTEAHLIINDPIFERNTETILCTFIKNKKKSEWICRMAIRVKNISSTLISKIELCTKSGSAGMCENTYVNPRIPFMELWLGSDQSEYAKSNLESMRMIYNNSYTNFEAEESIVCHLELPIDRFINAEEIKNKLELEEKEPQNAASIINFLFFDFYIIIETIYGERYLQKVHAGGRMIGNLLYDGKAAYVEPEYRRRDVYVLENIEMDVKPL